MKMLKIEKNEEKENKKKKFMTQVATTGMKSLSTFLNSEGIKGKFAEVFGDKEKGSAFISTVLSVVNSNGQLASADQNSLYTSCLLVASLDLSIHPGISQAFLVPFNTKQADGSYRTMVQVQISARGAKQLAMRSGQFININDSDVREGEIKSVNRLTGEIEWEWITDDKIRVTKPIIGYVCYFELVNGFKSTFYMSTEEMMAHAKKYSQTFKKFNSGLWKDEFSKMASKTIIKMHLLKNAPLTSSMQKAFVADQAVIKNDSFLNSETVDVETDYVDNDEQTIDIDQLNNRKERERVVEHIAEAKTLEELSQALPGISDEDFELITIYDDKKKSIEQANKKAK